MDNQLQKSEDVIHSILVILDKLQKTRRIGNIPTITIHSEKDQFDAKTGKVLWAAIFAEGTGYRRVTGESGEELLKKLELL